MKPDILKQLVQLGSKLLIDQIKNEPLINFRKESIGQSFSDNWTRRIIPIEEFREYENAFRDDMQAFAIANFKAIRFVEKEYFGGGYSHLAVKPADGFEWSDVLQEIYGPNEKDPLRVLSTSGALLFEKIGNREFTAGWISERSARCSSRIMGYRGFESFIEELLVKRGLKLSFETKPDQNSKFRRTLIRFKVLERARNLPPLCPPAPNPRFDYSGV